MRGAFQGKGAYLVSAAFLLTAALYQHATTSTAAEALSWYRDSSEWAGEELLHRLGADIDVSMHLPLSSLLQGLYLNHATLAARELWLAAAGLAQVMLLFILGCQLAALPGGLATVGLWVGMGARGLLHDGGFLQFLYTLPVLSVAAVLALKRSSVPAREALAALFLGASLMYRSTLAFFPPLLAFSARKRMALLPYLFLIPWLIMNWRQHQKFIPFEYREADLNVISGALGLVPTVSDWKPLTPQASALDDTRTGNVLGWAAGEVFRHPARYAASCLSRAKHVLNWHPWLSFLGFLSVLLWRGKQGFLPVGLLAFYLLAVHCLMSVNRDYFYSLWALLTPLAAGLFCRFLPAGDPANQPWITRAADAVLRAGAALALLLAFSTAVLVLRYDREASRFNSEIERWPEDPWLFQQRARRRLADGQRRPAVADMDRSLALRPGDLHKRYDLAWARFIAGDSSDLFAIDEDAASRLYGRAGLEILKALHHAQEGLQLLPRLHLERARYYFRQEASIGWAQTASERQALAKLRTARDLEFSRYAATVATRYRLPKERLRIIKLLEGLGLDDLQNSIADSKEHLLEHARALIKSDARKDTLAFLSRAESHASGAEGLRAVAGLYQEAGECARAVALLDKIIARFPEDAVLLKDRGICEHRLDRTKAAIASFSKALTLDAGLAEASLSLGAVYSEMGRHASAVEVYDQALARGPGSEFRKLLQSSRDEALRQLAR